MATRTSRSGGKYSGNHTTLIPLASILSEAANRCQAVTKISPGFIKAGLPSVQGKRRVKITRYAGRLLLSVRDNASHQEIHIYTTDPESVKKAIIKACEGSTIHVSFGKGK